MIRGNREKNKMDVFLTSLHQSTRKGNLDELYAVFLSPHLARGAWGENRPYF